MARTVVIVEDFEQVASNLEIALAAIPGVRIVRFLSGREASRFFAGDGLGTVDVLVTDLHLPGVDGFELIEQVRMRSALPIVVLSGDTDPETPARVRRLGVNAYFTKPCSMHELRRAVERLLGESGE